MPKYASQAGRLLVSPRFFWTPASLDDTPAPPRARVEERWEGWDVEDAAGLLRLRRTSLRSRRRGRQRVAFESS